MLSRMSFDTHTQAEFQRLIANEANILEAMARIEDSEVRRSLIDVVVLMTVYDGELAQREREFLTSAAKELNVPLDLDEVERRTQEYRVIAKRNIFERAAGVAGGATVRAGSVAGQAARGVRDTSALVGGKAKGVFSKALRRENDTGVEEPLIPESLTTTCSSCGREVATEFQFCPGCGQSTASEKACSSCSESIPIDSAFCPHCGASQN
jgi:RNA polymerase subunit RPABC4/transcription elongation factor Spt4